MAYVSGLPSFEKSHMLGMEYSIAVQINQRYVSSAWYYRAY